ncbi:hypothetical protein FQN57_005045 [Myotisia sp. PD_48]|nr:hypothetical protein FQN57_005045 [Myotisia sp. PD_48]
MKRKRQASGDLNDLSFLDTDDFNVKLNPEGAIENPLVNTSIDDLSQLTSINADSSAHPGPTVDGPLATILSVFPDICLDFVAQLYRDKKRDMSRPPSEEDLVLAILEVDSYPRASDNKRRKLGEEQKETRVCWGLDDDVSRDKLYWSLSISVIKLDFPHIPNNYIKEMLQMHTCFYNAYLAIEEKEYIYDTLSLKPYMRHPSLKYSTEMPPTEKVILERGTEELRCEVRDAREERRARLDARNEKKKEAEYAALLEENGGLLECRCCYMETPINRMIFCDSQKSHAFCHQCIQMNARTQVGLMKFELHCVDISGCKAPFLAKELIACLGDTLWDKLMEIQQQNEIAQAGIEGLEECPYCEFKAIYPSVEQDREFRCQRPQCNKITCRMCREDSHVPKSCEEFRKEKNIPLRHKVEEAMSEAIIRTCPNSKCKTPIIKEYGCNKLRCAKCGSSMCYVCKKELTAGGYGHFSSGGPGCPLHDQGDDTRHVQEAIDARAKALAEALKQNPNLREADISVEAPAHDPNSVFAHPHPPVRVARAPYPGMHNVNHPILQDPEGVPVIMPAYREDFNIDGAGMLPFPVPPAPLVPHNYDAPRHGQNADDLQAHYVNVQRAAEREALQHRLVLERQLQTLMVRGAPPEAPQIRPPPELRFAPPGLPQNPNYLNNNLVPNDPPRGYPLGINFDQPYPMPVQNHYPDHYAVGAAYHQYHREAAAYPAVPPPRYPFHAAAVMPGTPGIPGIPTMPAPPPEPIPHSAPSRGNPPPNPANNDPEDDIQYGFR